MYGGNINITGGYKRAADTTKGSDVIIKGCDANGNAIDGDIRLTPGVGNSGYGSVKICNEPTQKIGFYGVIPVIQITSQGETGGVNTSGAANLRHDSTFTGNVGNRTYTISDIVKALKQIGILPISDPMPSVAPLVIEPKVSRLDFEKKSN